MSNNNQLTAQQRAALFGANTRQHFQMLGSQTINGGAQNVNFRIPKARILQGIKLLCEATVNVKHASSTSIALPSKFHPYRLVRNIRVDYNNGFAPITASAEDLAMLNALRPNADMVFASANDDTLCKCPSSFTASSAGTNNTVKFMLDIPLTLNDRDPVGLVLAQNAETNIDLSIDVANGGEIIDNASGYTVTLSSVKFSPMTVSFSIPSNSNAFPDMSVLKIVDTRNEDFSAGAIQMKLPVGMIYRKLLLKFTDSNGSPLAASYITSNIELVLNTADIPYSISPEMLRAVNKLENGKEMPTGVYFLDLSYQGFNNYGGSRDYIDTETITEFVLRFTASTAGKIEVVSEKLSRLI